jgi:hypothetical protein
VAAKILALIQSVVLAQGLDNRPHWLFRKGPVAGQREQRQDAVQEVKPDRLSQPCLQACR